MATLLLVLIYIIYIGLGVPDSSFGSALPAMWQELNLPLSLGSVVTFIISIFTILSSFFSAKLINKFGEGLVVAFSTFLTAVALLGFGLSNAFWIVVISSIPLGFGAGAIDAALNHYVASRYSTLKVNFLHCFYGIGVALSPFVFSLALKDDNNWRLGYFIVCGIQIFLSVLAFCSLSLWKKIERKESEEENFKPELLSYKTLVKSPSIRAMWGIFFFTCALEFTVDTWGTTFMKVGGLTESSAASFLTLYYIGIAVGRFSAGFISKVLPLFKLLFLCYALIFVAIVLTFLPIPIEVKGASLFLIGLGNGPTFPNLTVASANWYGKKYSQSIVSAQMVISNLGILIIPAIFGLIANAVKREFITTLFPIYISALFFAILIFTLLFYKRPKQINLQNEGAFINANNE